MEGQEVQKEAQEKEQAFEVETQKSLEGCGRWLIEHSGDLAEQFICGGCRDWSVRFSAGEDGLFPNVKIEANKLVVTHEYGFPKRDGGAD